MISDKQIKELTKLKLDPNMIYKELQDIVKDKNQAYLHTNYSKLRVSTNRLEIDISTKLNTFEKMGLMNYEVVPDSKIYHK